MLRFILEGRLLRRLWAVKPLKLLLFTFLCFLIVVVLIYTVNLFLTLPERTSGHHVQHNSTH
jgi:hypothetical protein